MKPLTNWQTNKQINKKPIEYEYVRVFFFLQMLSKELVKLDNHHDCSLKSSSHKLLITLQNLK